MIELTWHKDAKPSTYYATHNGMRIATARKEATGGAWIGTVVGFGHIFGGRRLMDVKELAQRHVESIYGDGEWTLFPARDLKPGMILGCDSWKDGEREIVSVDVDTEAQTVSVELTSESARELGFTLDDTCAVDAMVRVKVVVEEIEEEQEQEQAPETPTVDDEEASPVLVDVRPTEHGTVWVNITCPTMDAEPSRKAAPSPVATPRTAAWASATGSPPAPAWEATSPSGATSTASRSRRGRRARLTPPLTQFPRRPRAVLRRLGWERPGPGARRLPCTLPTGHTRPHRDGFGKSFVRGEDEVIEDKVSAPVASPTEDIPSTVEGGVTMSLPMFEAMAEAFVKAHPDWRSMTPVEVTEALGCWTGKPNEPSREGLEREVHAAERHLMDLRRDYAHGFYRGDHGEERYQRDVESAKRVLRSFLAELDAIKPG
ncbi:hypothetical protein [Streptomyces brevispora]|uniref:hypothetical protein n=1 Tax=Streptomyces brevispora TaxID=887462 RepID=UPI0037FAD5E5